MKDLGTYVKRKFAYVSFPVYYVMNGTSDGLMSSEISILIPLNVRGKLSLVFCNSGG